MTAKKLLQIISTILVALVVLLAVALVGVRLAGIRTFTVLSGSMEPTYHVGSLIYVKKVDSTTIRPGQVITFMLDENTVATHRVVEVVPDEDVPPLCASAPRATPTTPRTAASSIIKTSSAPRCSRSPFSAMSQTTSSIPPVCMWLSPPERFC